MQWLKNVLLNHKTYVAAIGLAGLLVYQLSQQDWGHAMGTAVALGTMIGLKAKIETLLAGAAAKAVTPPSAKSAGG